MTCTRCETSGYLNLHQVDDATLSEYEKTGDVGVILRWIKEHPDTDVQVCDCCGDGEAWHKDPGAHDELSFGHHGPYDYNGGLPECY